MHKCRAKLHPLVDAYIHSDKQLGEVLNALPEPRDPATRALVVMREAVFGVRPAEEARALVESLDTTGADPGLLTVFYAVWGRFSVSQERYAEASSLYRKAWTLVDKRTPPEIKSLIMTFDAALYSATGRHDRAEARLAEMLSVIPKHSPQYVRSLGEWVLHLAEAGRGSEAEAEFALCFEGSRVEISGFREAVLLISHAETGRLEEAALCAASLRANAGAHALAGSIAYYDMIVSVLLDRCPTEPPDWAATLRELLAERPEQALAHERRQARKDSSFMYRNQFGHFNMIRAELANGQAEAARRLIRLRRQMGNTHYLDDFFLARVELLSGNREEAEGRFAAAYRACRRYRAEKRLEIELRMACEMSRADVMNLAAAAGRLPENLSKQTGGEPPACPAVPCGTARLVGLSPVMQELRRAIARIAPLDAPVLITGETGTGKELVAQAIHESDQRSARPFLAINCGAIAESLLESELFGHEKGAFTGAERAHRGLFEEAASGTILLDEIGEISPRLQVALLRVLENGEIRPVGSAKPRRIGCRIVAATNADLEALAGRGAFRKDLLYRLKRLEVHIPPLRERREDILPLADHFLAEGRSEGVRPRMSARLKAELHRRDWPGNVRELRNEIERMRLLNSDRTEYDLVHLGAPSSPASPLAGPPTEATAPPPAGAAASDNGVAASGFMKGCTRRGRLELVRGLFRDRERLSRAEIIRTLGISQATATAYLKQLCREGLVEKAEPTAAPRTHYFRLRSSGNR